MTVSTEQCRAARGLIGWSQSELSKRASVSRATIADFESGKRTPIANNLAAIRNALEVAGVQFLDTGDISEGAGVALRQT